MALPSNVAVAATMREAELESRVRVICQHLGLLAYHTHDSRRSEPGFPDWVVVGSKVLYRELKTEHGRLTGAQSRWLHALTAAGADAKVWRPSDLLAERIAQELAAVSWAAARP